VTIAGITPEGVAISADALRALISAAVEDALTKLHQDKDRKA
jgi:hypothetical protein